MAAYRVSVQESAKRDLRRLSAPVLRRALARLAAIAEEPRGPATEKLTATDAYRVRVGDYRILYEIDDAARTVVIVRVRHRRDAYRGLR